MNLDQIINGNHFVKLSANGKSFGDSKQILIN